MVPNGLGGHTERTVRAAFKAEQSKELLRMGFLLKNARLIDVVIFDMDGLLIATERLASTLPIPAGPIQA